jgi:hypothetical protein
VIKSSALAQRVFIAGLMACAALFWHLIQVNAQPPSLQQRVAKLRAEFQSVPTTEANYGERRATLEEWGDDLASRRRLFVTSDIRSAFYRFPTVTPQSAALVDRWTKFLAFCEENAEKTGQLARTDNNTLVAGAYSTMTFEYTVGDIELQKNGGLRIGQKFISNRPRLQANNPVGDSYVTFKVTRGSARVEPGVTLWQSVFSSIFAPVPMPLMKITDGTLRKGDKVLITVGDTSGLARGYRPMPRDADEFQFYVEIDPDGSGIFQQGAITATPILGDNAVTLNAVVPSIVAVNEPFAVRIRVEDQYGNPARFDGGEFQVLLNGKSVGSAPIAKGQYVGKLEGVRLPAEGAYRFTVRSADGSFLGVSNPVLAERNPKQRVYWGELHGHSGWEEGTGSVPRYYEFARDVAFLDFASLTGHDLFLAKPGWEQIRSETAKANRAGSFVAFMGYEWTQTYDKGGHHNVFFKTDKGKYVEYREAPRPDLLYARLRQVEDPGNVLIIPHAHEAGDWNYSDPEMQRLSEIYSGHGSFEYFGNRFLKRGFRMGFIAASDDHSGHPGYAPALVSTRGGLAAVYSPTLDRDGIWAGMKNRATYASSGKRPVLQFSAGGRIPGESVDAGAAPTFNARVLATAPIDHIDVIHNGVPEYSKDFLAPKPGAPSGVQIMLFSPTETAGDQVRPPLGEVSWGGWIEVVNGRIGSIEPLGLDAITDQFHLVDDRHVWFWSQTRGDFDGVMLKLASSPADTKINIRISTLDADAGGTGTGRGINWTSGIPSREKKHEVSFTLGDLAKQRGKFDLSPRAIVFAQKAALESPLDATFTYKPAKAPAQDDYYYLRLVQVDGEAAWSSPIWIGQEKRQR